MTGAILDVGAADGAHFDEWRSYAHWDIRGFEFHPDVVNDAQAHGRNVIEATMETYDPGEIRFDLIIMNHLLEHVADPAETLTRAVKLLKPGGFIVGEVPNIASVDFLCFGKYWGGCHWPRHLHQFEPKTMTKALRGAGFSDVRIGFVLHTSHWALSVQNRFQATSWGKVLLQNGRSWYYPFLLIAFVPINFIQKLFKCTGILSFRARSSIHS
jgi:SAM-dependent methyltransferase